MNQLINQVLRDRYQIQSLLGQKTGRRTFLATDLQTRSPVVIKLLLFNPDFTWDELKLFEREAETLSFLNHSAIPNYLDYFEIETELGKGFALVQTYINAPSLETVIQEGRDFSEVELIELAEKLLDILTYLHEQIPPVIHRDIKPSNILISNRSGSSIGDVYLVDFGSVQTATNKDNGTITIVGSYGYIPLEQFGGKTRTVSDLYSLGMTLIYLITGVHPAELTQVDGQVKFDSSNISYQFSKWLEKITQPYANKRFESAKLAKTALTSKDKISENYLDLRPANTQVKLYRDRHKLEIVYEENSPLVNGSSCLGCWFVFFVIVLSPILLKLLINSWIFLFIFVGVLVSVYLIGKNYYYLTEKYYKVISIERNTVIKVGNCYGKQTNIKWKPPFSCFENINFLAYSPGYTFNKYLDITGKTIRGGEVKIRPKLSIYAGHLEYSISSQKLSPAEFLWLGQELSDFLDLELQVIYSTPKVPPEPSCGGGC
ncbi:MAG: serine/threonine-protein kinase [Cyanobacteria bacterium P01_G01_bin.49]